MRRSRIAFKLYLASQESLESGADFLPLVSEAVSLSSILLSVNYAVFPTVTAGNKLRLGFVTVLRVVLPASFHWFCPQHQAEETSL